MSPKEAPNQFPAATFGRKLVQFLGETLNASAYKKAGISKEMAAIIGKHYYENLQFSAEEIELNDNVAREQARLEREGAYRLSQNGEQRVLEYFLSAQQDALELGRKNPDDYTESDFMRVYAMQNASERLVYGLMREESLRQQQQERAMLATTNADMYTAEFTYEQLVKIRESYIRLAQEFEKRIFGTGKAGKQKLIAFAKQMGIKVQKGKEDKFRFEYNGEEVESVLYPFMMYIFGTRNLFFGNIQFGRYVGSVNSTELAHEQVTYFDHAYDGMKAVASVWHAINGAPEGDEAERAVTSQADALDQGIKVEAVVNALVVDFYETEKVISPDDPNYEIYKQRMEQELGRKLYEGEDVIGIFEEELLPTDPEYEYHKRQTLADLGLTALRPPEEVYEEIEVALNPGEDGYEQRKATILAEGGTVTDDQILMVTRRHIIQPGEARYEERKTEMEATLGKPLFAGDRVIRRVEKVIPRDDPQYSQHKAQMEARIGRRVHDYEDVIERSERFHVGGVWEKLDNVWGNNSIEMMTRRNEQGQLEYAIEIDHFFQIAEDSGVALDAQGNVIIKGKYRRSFEIISERVRNYLSTIGQPNPNFDLVREFFQLKPNGSIKLDGRARPILKGLYPTGQLYQYIDQFGYDTALSNFSEEVRIGDYGWGARAATKGTKPTDPVRLVPLQQLKSMHLAETADAGLVVDWEQVINNMAKIVEEASQQGRPITNAIIDSLKRSGIKLDEIVGIPDIGVDLNLMTMSKNEGMQRLVRDLIRQGEIITKTQEDGRVVIIHKSQKARDRLGSVMGFNLEVRNSLAWVFTLQLSDITGLSIYADQDYRKHMSESLDKIIRSMYIENYQSTDVYLRDWIESLWSIYDSWRASSIDPKLIALDGNVRGETARHLNPVKFDLAPVIQPIRTRDRKKPSSKAKSLFKRTYYSDGYWRAQYFTTEQAAFRALKGRNYIKGADDYPNHTTRSRTEKAREIYNRGVADALEKKRSPQTRPLNKPEAVMRTNLYNAEYKRAMDELDFGPHLESMGVENLSPYYRYGWLGNIVVADHETSFRCKLHAGMSKLWKYIVAGKYYADAIANQKAAQKMNEIGIQALDSKTVEKMGLPKAGKWSPDSVLESWGNEFAAWVASDIFKWQTDKEAQDYFKSIVENIDSVAFSFPYLKTLQQRENRIDYLIFILNCMDHQMSLEWKDNPREVAEKRIKYEIDMMSALAAGPQTCYEAEDKIAAFRESGEFIPIIPHRSIIEGESNTELLAELDREIGNPEIIERQISEDLERVLPFRSKKILESESDYQKYLDSRKQHYQKKYEEKVQPVIDRRRLYLVDHYLDGAEYPNIYIMDNSAKMMHDHEGHIIKTDVGKQEHGHRGIPVGLVACLMRYALDKEIINVDEVSTVLQGYDQFKQYADMYLVA